MKYIGITERGDAALDNNWMKAIENKEISGAILITKNPNIEFAKQVQYYQRYVPIIVHCTITTYGGSILEPNVKPYTKVFEEMMYLAILIGGRNIVLRIDPIIPTKKSLIKIAKLLSMLNFMNKNQERDLSITRIRYSFMDMYNHVKERFKNSNIKLPYESFHAPQNMIDEAIRLFNIYQESTGWIFESCAENTPHKIGCISKRDIEIMNIKDFKLIGNKNQRSGCLCPLNKKELLTQCKRCKHGCLYCYWRD